MLIETEIKINVHDDNNYINYSCTWQYSQGNFGLNIYVRSRKNYTFYILSFWEKAMAPHSSTLAWKIPWMEEPGGLLSMGLLSRTRLSNFTFTFHFHALEKEIATHSSVLAWRIPRDWGAWWAAVCGVAQSRTRLKWLSSSSSMRLDELLGKLFKNILEMPT